MSSTFEKPQVFDGIDVESSRLWNWSNLIHRFFHARNSSIICSLLSLSNSVHNSPMYLRRSAEKTPSNKRDHFVVGVTVIRIKIKKRVIFMVGYQGRTLRHGSGRFHSIPEILWKQYSGGRIRSSDLSDSVRNRQEMTETS